MGRAIPREAYDVGANLIYHYQENFFKTEVPHPFLSRPLTPTNKVVMTLRCRIISGRPDTKEVPTQWKPLRKVDSEVKAENNVGQVVGTYLVFSQIRVGGHPNELQRLFLSYDGFNGGLGRWADPATLDKRVVTWFPSVDPRNDKRGRWGYTDEVIAGGRGESGLGVGVVGKPYNFETPEEPLVRGYHFGLGSSVGFRIPHGHKVGCKFPSIAHATRDGGGGLGWRCLSSDLGYNAPMSPWVRAILLQTDEKNRIKLEISKWGNRIAEARADLHETEARIAAARKRLQELHQKLSSLE